MRPLLAEINLSYLRENYQFLKSLHGGKMLAVVKADAYGHDAIACARALQDIADGFAVACLEEAIALREADIELPIVLLEGVFEAVEYRAVDEYHLWPVIQTKTQWIDFQEYSWENRTCVWLKMDSGMRRAGFQAAEYGAIYQEIQQHSAVGQIVKMTHLACADEENHSLTDQQINTFDQYAHGLCGEESIANSAGILAHSTARRDWGRAGLALYGILPAKHLSGSLKPVMTLKTRVFAERQLAIGDVVGYGAIFRAQQPMRVGLIAAGYADGYPRVPSHDNPVWIDGKMSRIVGRVSMDMIIVELNDEKQGIGSEVELWGEHVSVNEIAERAHTIAYEILCHLKRAKKIFVV